MSQRLSSDPPLAGLRIAITLHKASNLLAKDRNLFGKRTSSDPYVKVFYSGSGIPIGKTPVKKKTVSPEWNHTLKHVVGSNEGETIRNATTASSMQKPNYPSLLLVLYDHDNGSSDDLLGQCTIPIPFKGIENQWFTLQTGNDPKSKYYCKKTKGEIQVSVKTLTFLLPDIVRGNDIPLKLPNKNSFLNTGLGWEVSLRQGAVDLDVSCVAVGNKGDVLMEETVYFANLKNPNGSIIHSGDEQQGVKGLGNGSDDREQISIDLNNLPPTVCAYILLVTVATPGLDFSQVTSARVRITDGVSGMG